jgi:DNA-binding transcriptional regulator YiaG
LVLQSAQICSTYETARMQAADLIAWRKRMKLSAAAAARELGCSRTSLKSWESGATRIPRYIGLACSALSNGWDEWRPQR